MTDKDSSAERIRAKMFGAGWARFNVERKRAEAERDADPVRKARSEAWTAAGKGATEEQRVAAANEAEIVVRKALGMAEIPESDYATTNLHPSPSDARRTGLRRQ